MNKKNTASSNKKLKIILAEDDKFIFLAYKDGFERAGFNVIHAADGAEAIKKIKHEKPDMILLDIIMPEKDGFEVLEEIKKNPATKRIPAIILSNLSQDSDIRRGKDLGAADYFVKANLSMSEVVEKVSGYFKPPKKKGVRS